MLCLTSWGPGCLEDVWWGAPEYQSQLWFNQRHLGHWKEIHAALRRAHESSLTFFWHATRPFNQFSGFIWLWKLSSLAGPQAPHWRTLFLGQMGKLSTHIYKRVACRHAYCFFEISLWEVIHQPIQSSWLYKRRFYDDFRFNAIMSQQLHRHQRSSGQLRAHSRELWAKTHKSACRLIDLL